MCAKSDQFAQPDGPLARLFANALQTDQSASTGSPCPDAEQIAAYADQGLAAAERNELERHFGTCVRCQSMLATLGDELQVLPETATVPESSHVNARPDRRPNPKRPWLWWLAPAFATSAAVLLWVILRPDATAPVQTAANYKAESQSSAAPAAAASPSTRKEATPQQFTSPNARNLDRLKTNGASNNEAGKSPNTPSETSAQIATLSAEPAPAIVPRAIPAPPAAPSAPGTTLSDQAPPSLPPAAAQSARLNAPATAEQSSLQPRAAVANAITAAKQSPAAPPDNAEKPQIVLYTFSPPDGSVTWRLGTGGLVQLSADRGQTWQQQPSGVTADLVAGSASAKDAAWVVGRGGVILRTADGEHWERVPAPVGVNSEWAAVATHDAQNATVAAEDLRRFSTTDGGRTWIQQQ